MSISEFVQGYPEVVVYFISFIERGVPMKALSVDIKCIRRATQ